MIKPRFKPEQYREIKARLDDMYRESRARSIARQTPLDGELALQVATGGPDGLRVVMTVKVIRDLARWAGATKVGRTLDDACLALARACDRERRLMRDQLGKPRLRARYQALRLKRRAHECGRPVADQRAVEKLDQERSDLTGKVRSDRAFARERIARFAWDVRGNGWCESEALVDRARFPVFSVPWFDPGYAAPHV